MRRSLALIAFSFLPVVALSSVGILILVFQRGGFDIVFGVLILILAVTVLTGGVLAAWVMGTQARRARLQTDFVAKVSHELRTPLASIRMFVDTLQEGVVDPQEEALCLDVISTETSRLTSMIERLLRWGRMESGRRVYELRPEAVETLVGEAVAQLELQLASTGIEVDLQLPEHPLAVNADRAAMVETLLNLLNNAVKYGGAGGTIRVRVREEKKRVLVDVEDDGPGISRKEHRRIFERFYRGTDEEVARIQGSGLGLAMAQLVVKSHKGRIRVSSSLGQGACFTLDLPALPDPAAALEVPPG
jgi:two-component system, OmpR family, phosphate regulon sensor histidine kinase PhoR